jgi:L-fuconolactonase
MNAPRMIDTHVHVISDDLERYPMNPQGRPVPWYSEAPCTTEQLLELMDAAGVDKTCLVQAFSAYGGDNSYFVDSANAHPDRLVSVVYVPFGDPDPAGRLASWAAKGAAGVRVMGSAGPNDPTAGSGAPPGLDHPSARALIAQAKASGLGIILTSRFGELDQVHDLLEEDPELVVVIDHCAWPGPEQLAGGSSFPNAAPLFDLAKYPGVHLKVSSITLDRVAKETAGDPRPFVNAVVERFGPQRVMWGSNWSATYDRPYEAIVELGRHAFSDLSEAEQQRSFVDAAIAVWPKLKGPAEGG